VHVNLSYRIVSIASSTPYRSATTQHNQLSWLFLQDAAAGQQAEITDEKTDEDANGADGATGDDKLKSASTTKSSTLAAAEDVPITMATVLSRSPTDQAGGQQRVSPMSQPTVSTLLSSVSPLLPPSLWSG